MRMSMSSSIFFGVVVFFFCLSLSSLSSLVSAQHKGRRGVFCPLSNDDDDAQKKKGGVFWCPF